MRRQVVAVSVGVALVLGGGAASAVTKAPGSVRACASRSAALSMLSKGKCAKGSSPVTLAVRGPIGRTGATGATGAAGVPGPSDVYGWSGTLDSATPTSATVTVPAGDYVLRWQGFVVNFSGAAVAVSCSLTENDHAATEFVLVPAPQSLLDSSQALVHAASSWTTSILCSLPSNVELNNAVLTATATGTLHAAASSLVTLP